MTRSRGLIRAPSATTSEPTPRRRARPTRSEFGRQFAAAAEKSGLGALARDEKLSGHDLLIAVGGVRGILEALLPGLVFLVVYSSLTASAARTRRPR